jgi:molecular chaperone GrpE
MTSERDIHSTEPEAVDGVAHEAMGDDPPLSELDQLKAKADSYLDLAQRTQADFQNYKRRMEQDRERWARDANAELIRHILPAIDDWDRAMAHAPANLGEQSWETGLLLVGQKLRTILEQQGLVRIGEVGEEFDPREHDAVAAQETTEFKEGRITSVFRAGYRLNDRVIRPAQVVVARAPGSGPGHSNGHASES